MAFSATVASGTSEAATQKVSVPAKLIFDSMTDPVNPGYCTAVTFLKWRIDSRKVLAWQAQYKFGPNNTTYKETVEPPFDDVFSAPPGRLWTVPKGSHWTAISVAGADGPPPVDCSSMEKTMRDNFRSPRMNLTIDTSVGTGNKCDRAKLKVQKKKDQLQNAKNKGNKKKIKRARKALKKAKKKQRKACKKKS